jgi:hypothetical protein
MIRIKPDPAPPEKPDLTTAAAAMRGLNMMLHVVRNDDERLAFLTWRVKAAIHVLAKLFGAKAAIQLAQYILDHLREVDVEG